MANTAAKERLEQQRLKRSEAARELAEAEKLHEQYFRELKRRTEGPGPRDEPLRVVEPVGEEENVAANELDMEAAGEDEEPIDAADASPFELEAALVDDNLEEDVLEPMVQVCPGAEE